MGFWSRADIEAIGYNKGKDHISSDLEAEHKPNVDDKLDVNAINYGDNAAVTD